MAPRVRQVVWAESARDALDEVITYVAQDSRQAAGHVLEAAMEAAASLATLSERGRVVPEINDSAIREMLVFRYRLMYRVEDDRVVVAAFVHGGARLCYLAPGTGLDLTARRRLTSEWSRRRGPDADAPRLIRKR